MQVNRRNVLLMHYRSYGIFRGNVEVNFLKIWVNVIHLSRDNPLTFRFFGLPEPHTGASMNLHEAIHITVGHNFQLTCY